jgi:hypothetical protein
MFEAVERLQRDLRAVSMAILAAHKVMYVVKLSCPATGGLQLAVSRSLTAQRRHCASSLRTMSMKHVSVFDYVLAPE